MSGGGYYDLDAVLLGQEHVPCTLTQGVIKLGHLDVSQQGAEHLVEGTRLELPYWAVEQWEDKAGPASCPPAKPYCCLHGGL